MNKKKIIMYAVTVAAVIVAVASVIIMLHMKNGKLTANEHIENGNSFIESGDYDKAAAAFGMAIDIEPDNMKAYMGLADTYIKSGDASSAEGVYEEAAEAGEKYYDSENKISDGTEALLYDYADFLMAQGRDEDAYRLLSNAENMIPEILESYDNGVLIADSANAFEYHEGKAVINGDGLISFGGYMCSRVDSSEVPVALRAGEFSDDRLTVGNLSYVRKDNGNGGYNYYRRENILWDIVDENDEGYLLLCHNIIDTRRFSEIIEDVTWDKSDLREWLNGDFMNTAFSEEQKEMMSVINVDAPSNVMYGTGGGARVKDYVTLPSLDESISTEHGFDGNAYSAIIERAAEPTDYAKDMGTAAQDNGNGRWWLRTMGSDYRRATYMSEDGAVVCAGEMVSDGNIGVRPMIFIKKDAVSE